MEAQFVRPKPAQPPPDPVIAAVLPMSGVDAAIGLQMQRGIALALEESEFGQAISIEITDNESDDEVTTRVARRLRRTEGVRGVVGDLSPERADAFDHAMQRALVVVAPADYSRAPSVTQAMAAARFASASGWTNAMIVQGDSDFWTSRAFRKERVLRGGSVVATVEVARLPTRSFGGVDVVVAIGTHEQVAQISTTMHTLAPAVPVIGLGDLASVAVTIPVAIAGLYLVEPFAPRARLAEAFAKGFQERFGVAPTSAAAVAFDGTLCLLAQLAEYEGAISSTTEVTFWDGELSWGDMEIIQHTRGAVSYLGRY